VISDIRLQSFRSYNDETFEFGEGVNIIVGPNASGKTNLLEAILVTCSGSSYRAGSAELITFSKPWARLEAHVDGRARIVKIDNRVQPAKKTYEIDDRVYARLPHSKTVPWVLFEPSHLRLLHGSPESRREYIDDLLEQTVTGFGAQRRAYKRTLAQRNNLLKKLSPTGANQLFAWNVRLSELGGQIFDQRRALVSQLSPQVAELYNQLSNDDKRVELVYRATCSQNNYGSQMLHKLEASMEDDILRGFTACGPHRDDFSLVLNSRPAPEVASRGEIRTALLALKIAELRLVESIRGSKPILLLDDVFSELDGARRQALTKHLANYQTFITTTDADVVLQHFMQNCTVIPISTRSS
jgi:DNA replication and repair protein RecF